MRYLLLALAVVLGIYYSLFRLVVNNIDESAQEYKAHLGEQYIIGKDTLEVIDYSMLLEQYTLSNGMKVSKNLVNKE